MHPGRDAIIIAWVHEEGTSEPTGRTVMRDGYLRPELRPAPLALACVWSRDPADLPSGHAYAKTQGAKLFVMRDTDDVLARARALVLPQR